MLVARLRRLFRGCGVLALLCWSVVALFSGDGAAATQTPSPLDVAAASDLRFVFEELGILFEQQTQARIRLTFGSSGQLKTQIEQGAPFDVFFSANDNFVHNLVAQGLVLPDTVRLYAIGRIVLWVRSASPLDIGTGLSLLRDERIRYVAIANPAHAPYGLAAVQALRTTGLFEWVQTKFVLGENISQTLQFVQTGNADVGIVALSLAVAPVVRTTGRYWLIPGYIHQPIRQGAGVVARSKQQARARAFLTFVNGPTGRPVMQRYGFTLPGEAPAQ